ncbi:GntR family transcriptional regulator, partial [Mesorhizobium sp. M7A.F.Ca.CA.002.11.2.1]|uniref:GntR family transcriptional regulator n=1 Tax=Mesorhizobium sp. M7A.F.Ca.CA.002.11.2.1 TaxID=2496734 RepID=UPI0013E2E68B
MIYSRYIRRAHLISTAASTSAEPAATRAYHVLEHMIVTLELAPASFVTEGALIDRLGLGRTPVREAIQRLAWEGLLDIRPRAGIAIAPLHPGDWLRVLDARRGVEVVLARSAARFVTREAADLFHEAALAMQKAVISGNVLAFIQADKALDEALALAADNPFAARLAAPLHTPSPRFRFRYK